ncbi:MULTISPECIES: VOC family protein [unclassified Exiguobacterium]|uniref:VOC family protein n=1 Tax=unclassified Exiguobacterium TaxID=2644629 RepID=UPI001BE51F20|nr:MULTISPECIES: VOC family protein [unclassified Exiguobacterium]
MKIENIELGPVTLRVRDIEQVTQFYVDVIGMSVQEETEELVTLGTKERPLVILHSVPEAKTNPRAAGLFHLAILLPNRVALGSILAHLIERRIEVGQGDHLVSEAFYLSDPEGNGIELYADRPKEQWSYEANGHVKMATEPVDYESMLQAAANRPFTGLPVGTTMGHVHFKVRSIEAAKRFYHDRLGFSITTDSYPGALFLAADGYHHHVGTNVWARPSDELGVEAGLEAWTLLVDEETNQALGGTSSEWSLTDEDGITVHIKRTGA